jgi:hypothetical protein
MSEDDDDDGDEEQDGGGGGGSYYGPVAASGGNGHGPAGGGEGGRRRQRDEVLWSVARVLLGIGRYVVQVRDCLLCHCRHTPSPKFDACLSFDS